MKQLVLKVPTIVFAVPVLSPILILLLQTITEKELISIEFMAFLKPIGTIVMFIWLFSIVDYFRSKAPDFKHLSLIYLLLFLDIMLRIADWIFFHHLSLTDLYYWVITFLQLINFIALTALLTLFIRRVFYARSTWFVVIEIFSVIVGILTLTPEIKRYEKG